MSLFTLYVCISQSIPTVSCALLKHCHTRLIIGALYEAQHVCHLFTPTCTISPIALLTIISPSLSLSQMTTTIVNAYSSFPDQLRRRRCNEFSFGSQYWRQQHLPESGKEEGNRDAGKQQQARHHRARNSVMDSTH